MKKIINILIFVVSPIFEKYFQKTSSSKLSEIVRKVKFGRKIFFIPMFSCTFCENAMFDLATLVKEMIYEFDWVVDSKLSYKDNKSIKRHFFSVIDGDYTIIFRWKEIAFIHGGSFGFCPKATIRVLVYDSHKGKMIEELFLYNYDYFVYQDKNYCFSSAEDRGCFIADEFYLIIDKLLEIHQKR